MTFLRRWTPLLLVLSLCALPLRGDAASSVTFVIPNVFATASGNVPASQLDTNFSGILNAVSGIALAQRDLVEAQANLALARVQLLASWHKVRTSTGETVAAYLDEAHASTTSTPTVDVARE